MLGHTGEEVYVPRALWTESLDSPLKHRSVEFDPKQHARDVMKSQQMHGSMRGFVKLELGKQVQHNATVRQSMHDDKRTFAEATFSDTQRVVHTQSVERDAVEESKRIVKAGLDEQRAEAVRRTRENQAREMHEAAEMKLRTVKLLCEEMDERNRRRQVAQREAEEVMRQIEAKQQAQNSDRQREATETRRMVQANAMRAEHQQVAQQQRLRAAQEKQERDFKRFSDTTAQAEATKREDEESRVDRGVTEHQALTDLHYSRREAAREMQRLRMVNTLKGQVDEQKHSKSLLTLQKQVEKDMVNQNTQKNFEQELQRFHRKRQEELQLQKDLVEMMAKKQQQAKSEGWRAPAAASTMMVTPGMLADARTRAAPSMEKSASSPELNQCLGASRYLAKPCGRPGERPPTGTVASAGRQSMGNLGRGDDAGAAAPAARGQGPVLSTTALLAARDKRLSQSWHQGLSPAEMKAARQAAARRGAIAAADKADT